ncbi:MAG: U32 family peptidase [Bacteroidaceae bacterium]|nr:U32 family peptidase [Bacteroidaceae bacterium]
MKSGDFEIMAPVGSFASLTAAIHAGADAVYFGVEQLNMRAHSANHFSLADLKEIVRQAEENGVKTYLTVNTIIYDAEIAQMQEICRTAKEAGVSAVIASDVAVLLFCRSIGMEVHLSTQLNISNCEALRFYAQYADVVVLARELNLEQVAAIHHFIETERVCGPSGHPLRIEMFCHGALCMAVSGKCYLSLDNLGRSANRGECMQVCRRGYTVRDIETGTELDVQNKYIMSPKDLKTIGFIDRMMKAGVRVFKIEGRARAPEYVATVTACYKEAVQAVCDGTFTPAKVAEWDTRLTTVFNRGFWDGYYLGQRLGEWSKVYGSQATERKVYVGRGVKYFSKLAVGEFKIEAAEITQGDTLLLIGPTAGACRFTAGDIHGDDGPIEVGRQGQTVAVAVPCKVRPSDKLYKIVEKL